MRNRKTVLGPVMHATRPKSLFPLAFILFANACNAEIADVTSTTTASTSTSRTEVICSYAPSQSSIVSHLAATAGGSAIAAASVAQAAGLTAVLHSSGAYIFTSAGGYVAGTLGTAAALPAIVTVGVVAGGTAATLELICASTNHPELASKVKAAASEFMTRSKRMLADTSAHTVATAKPFIAESKTVVAKVRADAFEYASRASVQLSETFRSKVK
ncbi:hypothetical protein [Massilia sp. PWRC2]|uniref:hypothetical protein n=1 Tax=Massilia sp. PWRC2 TaxID=2804626 RepID=UPI003CEE6D3A